jgi:hypothetical protein
MLEMKTIIEYSFTYVYMMRKTKKISLNFITEFFGSDFSEESNILRGAQN